DPSVPDRRRVRAVDAEEGPQGAAASYVGDANRKHDEVARTRDALDEPPLPDRLRAVSPVEENDARPAGSEQHDALLDRVAAGVLADERDPAPGESRSPRLGAAVPREAVDMAGARVPEDERRRLERELRRVLCRADRDARPIGRERCDRIRQMQHLHTGVRAVTAAGGERD